MADQSPAPLADRDWTVEVTDRIESVVEIVRDKTAVPATKVAEMIVFGVVAALLALVAFVSSGAAAHSAALRVPPDPPPLPAHLGRGRHRGSNISRHRGVHLADAATKEKLRHSRSERKRDSTRRHHHRFRPGRTYRGHLRRPGQPGAPRHRG